MCYLLVIDAIKASLGSYGHKLMCHLVVWAQVNVPPGGYRVIRAQINVSHGSYGR